jgi:1,2-dihydroxy-3,5-cyclohexadiene-1,4-dicarboxylate dehydrogenase
LRWPPATRTASARDRAQGAAALPEADRARITLYGPASVFERTAAHSAWQRCCASEARRGRGELPAAAAVPGRIDAAAGASAVASATAALQACRRGEVDAVVACPHHETAIHQAGIAFSGYPSLVARVCGVPEDSVFLMLVGGGLRIVHATLHESVAHRARPADAGAGGARDARGRQGLCAAGRARPVDRRVRHQPACVGRWLFGPEDAAIVVPAVAGAARRRPSRRRPGRRRHAAGQHGRVGHDLYVAMLHDQGHIPVKLLAPQAASALSIGADALLSSVGHGSAMDIAGRGIGRSAGRAAHDRAAVGERA